MEYAFESIGPALRYVVLVFMLVFAVVGLLVIVLLAAMPGQLAKRAGHPQAKAINICGWLGFPTGVLWVVAMVWALTRRPLIGSPDVPSTTDDLEGQLDRLEQAIQQLEKQLEA